jgi:hypothetical protein
MKKFVRTRSMNFQVNKESGEFFKPRLVKFVGMKGWGYRVYIGIKISLKPLKKVVVITT